MDIVLQVLGTVGLVETVVEFAYVITNRENFTPFEEVFFLTSGCIEMLGEVLFLLMGIRILLLHKDCKGVKALVQDPVHNVAKAFLDEVQGKNAEKQYGVYSAVSICVSVLPLPVWATFWPVWGSLFDGDGDEGLRLALSICSLGLICVFVFFGCKQDDMYAATVVVFVMYAMEKVFEEYILLSDLERLIPGDLGKALVGFQMTEILSVVFILACFAWAQILETSEPTENDGPM